MPPLTLTNEQKKYILSGEYYNDIKMYFDIIKKYVNYRLLENKIVKSKKLAFIFDIDEVCLTNIHECPDIYNSLFKNKNAKHDKLIIDQFSPEMPNSLKLFKFILKNKIDVFFITGRPEESRKYTEDNLKLVGYKGYSKLYLCPDKYNKSSMKHHKTNCRKEIINNGYTIICNVGDQESDIKGGYSEKTFLLPNPFYKIE
jgi:predicted secreted acid phosphatase